MPEDTPNATPGDPHPSLPPDRNEDELSGVAMSMDQTTPPQATSQDTGEIPVTTGTTEAEPEADPSTEALVESPSEPPSDVIWPSDTPFVPFVYDDPTAARTTDSALPPTAAASAPDSTRRRGGAMLFLIGSAVAGVLGAVLTLGVLAATGTFDTVAVETPTTTIPVIEATPVVADAPSFEIINDLGSALNPTAVAFKNVPSVVTITVFDTPEDDDSPTVGVGSGSGVVISTEGYIVTNEHVIEGGDRYSVTFEDGRVYIATLVGSDDLTDLAVLQIEADGLTPVDYGSSESLKLGDPAVAIGNPLGQDGGVSVTVGIISAFDRRVDFANDDFLHGMIQTDAAINSGSSGGALFDADGLLIGITSAIGVSQAGPEGIGYAIPIELVDRITSEIIETGDVAHPFLGVEISTFVEEADDGAVAPAGAEVQTITSTDAAAATAGLQVGDVIIMIGDKPIVDQTGLILAVRLYRVGDEVEFIAIRDGETMSFAVVMGQRPAEFGG